MRWYTKIPRIVEVSLSAIQVYYHNEAFFRGELEHIQGNHGLPASDDGEFVHQDGYTSEIHPFGYEAEVEAPNASCCYRPQFSGRVQMKHLIISSAVHKLYFEQAACLERYPAVRSRQDGTTLIINAKTIRWIENGVDHIETHDIIDRASLSAREDQLLASTVAVITDYGKAIVERIEKLNDLENERERLLNRRQELQKGVYTVIKLEKVDDIVVEIQQSTQALDNLASIVILRRE